MAEDTSSTCASATPAVPDTDSKSSTVNKSKTSKKPPKQRAASPSKRTGRDRRTTATPPRTPSPSTTTVTFATPLPQSTRSSTLEWRFPRPFSHLTLIGKSRAAWHTSFVIPQLNMLLDAGLVVNNLRPKHVFLTHGHSDHCLCAPVFISAGDPPDVYCPQEMAGTLDEYLGAKVRLNRGGGFDELKSWKEKRKNGGVGLPDDEDEDVDVEEEGDEDLDDDPEDVDIEVKTHYTHGLVPGSTATLRRQPTITATAFDCDHKVPCLGYVFHQNSQKLLPQFSSLSGPEIKDLRLSGTTITHTVSTPMFAFLGDTTANTLLAEPEWLKQGVKVVITECSFLYEEHRKNAEKTKHTIWKDLEKVVRKYPDTTFVLIHFSLRYTVEDIRHFFETMEDKPSNIVVWIDGGK